MASITGTTVDRPPVCFYELNGLDEEVNNPDPYNVFNHPSWKPLLDLTKERTDRIVMRSVPFLRSGDDDRVTTEVHDTGSVTTTTTKMVAGGNNVPVRTLRQISERRTEANTAWTTEHLLKDMDDLKAYLDMPIESDLGVPDFSGVLATEEVLGETGIVMIDTGDPICSAASLFDFGTYCITAMTERPLFRSLLDRFADTFYRRTAQISEALPGRLWRIYGPEYASPPYLPPSLFDEYVSAYDRPIVESILSNGGFPRIHSHGNLSDILPSIVDLGATGLDPIEPPSQGDVLLSDVRKRYGDRLTLFGNIEVSEIETMPPEEFRSRAIGAVADGTIGDGRGFVLMPSACPCGREVTSTAMENYEILVESVQDA